MTTRTFSTIDPPISHELLEWGAGPSVVLLHELPGMTEPALGLANHLVASGFRVHVPVLYGRPGHGGMIAGTARAMWCLRRELNLFQSRADSPVVRWLQALVRDVATDAHPLVGVVGMCMTGGLAIASLAEPRTGAAVASQPSLPMRLAWPPTSGQAALGLPEDVMDDAVASAASLLALRHAQDWICRAERFAALQRTFAGDQPGDQAPLGPGAVQYSWAGLRLITVDGPGHSVLTEDDPYEPAIAATITFLQDNLGVTPP